MQKAIFLDKDGTLIKDVPYNVNREKIEFFPDTVETLEAFKRAGFELIVISNQAGVAHGYFTQEALLDVSDEINKRLAFYNISMDGFYYCPHHPDGKVKMFSHKCNCRKPSPGLLIEAAIRHQIDLKQSWMIGDILNDVEAGKRAGCNTILMDVGSETEWILNENRKPDYVVRSLKEAKDKILDAEAALVMGGIVYEGRIDKSNF